MATIQSLFGILDDHLVRYTADTCYVIGEFGHEVLFGCVFSFAAHRDHAKLCLDRGV
jgi:hypothetical protein